MEGMAEAFRKRSFGALKEKVDNNVLEKTSAKKVYLRPKE